MHGAPAADDETKDDVEDDVVEDAADATIGTDAKISELETTMKPLRQLFELYKAQDVVVDLKYENLPQSAYVDLTDANAIVAKQLANSGHKAANCPNEKMPRCRQCGKDGHTRANCPGTYTLL